MLVVECLTETVCDILQRHDIDDAPEGGYVCVECGEYFDYDPYADEDEDNYF